MAESDKNLIFNFQKDLEFQLSPKFPSKDGRTPWVPPSANPPTTSTKFRGEKGERLSARCRPPHHTCYS